MKLNEKQFSKAVSVISSDVNRHVILSLYRDNVKTYKEIRKLIEDYKNWHNSSNTAYYVHHLSKNKILRKDRQTGWYYLTRFGIDISHLIYGLQEKCMEYDMDDVGADGKITVSIQR